MAEYNIPKLTAGKLDPGVLPAHNHLRKVVVFGDSWTTTLDGVSIPEVMAERLGGMVAANYGVAGAFLGPASHGTEGDVKSSEVQVAAAASAALDKATVTDVVAIFGANNLGGYLPTITQARDLFAAFRLYPNARYWFAANGRRSINNSSINDPWQRYSRMFAGASAAGFAVGRFSPMWGWDPGAATYWPGGSSDTSVHMNAAGQTVWASRLAGFMNGREYVPFVKPPITLHANATALQAEASISNDNSYIDGGTLWLSFTLQCRNASISDDLYQAVATIDSRYCPIGDYMTYPVGVRISGGQMSQAYSFRIQQGGVIETDGRAIKTNTGYTLFKAAVPLNTPKAS